MAKVKDGKSEGKDKAEASQDGEEIVSLSVGMIIGNKKTKRKRKKRIR